MRTAKFSDTAGTVLAITLLFFLCLAFVGCLIAQVYVSFSDMFKFGPHRIGGLYTPDSSLADERNACGADRPIRNR
jgi:hypothetical protein